MIKLFLSHGSKIIINNLDNLRLGTINDISSSFLREDVYELPKEDIEDLNGKQFYIKTSKDKYLSWSNINKDGTYNIKSLPFNKNNAIIFSIFSDGTNQFLVTYRDKLSNFKNPNNVFALTISYNLNNVVLSKFKDTEPLQHINIKEVKVSNDSCLYNPKQNDKNIDEVTLEPLKPEHINIEGRCYNNETVSYIVNKSDHPVDPYTNKPIPYYIVEKFKNKNHIKFNDSKYDSINNMKERSKEAQRERIMEERMMEERMMEERMMEERIMEERIMEERIMEERIMEERMRKERMMEERMMEERMMEERMMEERMMEERMREERMREEKMREEKMREEKMREERMREERMMEERMREEKMREEKMREEKMREERMRDEKMMEERMREEKMREEKMR
jgi:hypothetical protein